MRRIIFILSILLFSYNVVRAQNDYHRESVNALYMDGFSSLQVYYGAYKSESFEVFYREHKDYSFFVVPIEKGSVIDVVGNSNTSELFFLKQAKIPSGEGKLEVVDNCKKHYYSFEAVEKRINAPFDAQYMFVVREIAGVNRLPSELILNGHNIIHPQIDRNNFINKYNIQEIDTNKYINAISTGMSSEFSEISYFQAPVMVVCDDDNRTIVIGAEAKREDGSCPFYACSISRDGGKTFIASVKYLTDGKEVVLAGREGKKTPVPMTELLYDHEVNRILSLTSSYCYASDDFGETWYLLSDFSAKVKVPEGYTGRSYSPTSGIQLTNGILAAPMRFINRSKTENKIQAEVNFVLYSKDHGKTWDASPCTPQDIIVDEVTIVEYAKNQVMLNARGGTEFWMDSTLQGRRVFIPNRKSKNNLQRWEINGWKTEAKSDRKLFDPICNAALLKSGEGRKAFALFCNPVTEGDSWPRCNLVLQITRNFKKWTPVCLLTPYGEKNQGYSDLGTNGRDYYFAYEEYKGSIKFADITSEVMKVLR